MSKQTKNELVINGSGSSGGGTFETVKINGSGTINGDIISESLKGSGSSRVNGSIQAADVSFSGTGRVKGKVDCLELIVNGSGTFEDNVIAKHLKFRGSGSIEGNLRGEGVNVHGSLTVGGDSESDSFNLHGGFSVDGMLNAEEIEIKLHGDSDVREIGCSSITVKKGNGTLSKLFKLKGAVLKTEIIEGDEIYLENTEANIVRGGNVKIGPGCTIKKVEYRGDYECSEAAKVNEAGRLN